MIDYFIDVVAHPWAPFFAWTTRGAATQLQAATRIEVLSDHAAGDLRQQSDEVIDVSAGRSLVAITRAKRKRTTDVTNPPLNQAEQHRSHFAMRQDTTSGCPFILRRPAKIPSRCPGLMKQFFGGVILMAIGPRGRDPCAAKRTARDDNFQKIIDTQADLNSGDLDAETRKRLLKKLAQLEARRPVLEKALADCEKASGGKKKAAAKKKPKSAAMKTRKATKKKKAAKKKKR